MTALGVLYDDVKKEFDIHAEEIKQHLDKAIAAFGIVPNPRPWAHYKDAGSCHGDTDPNRWLCSPLRQLR
jgi:hypothetical protein